MHITVIGSGYVGLVDGACFAETGNHVICVDVDASKIDKLNQGIIPIYEPGLDNLIKKNVEQERLSFTTDIAAAVKKSDICFISVGTPPGEDGSADLQYVLAAAKSIGEAMEQYTPVGTAENVKNTISKLTDIEFDVVSNPEFLKEGAAISDFMKPDRIIIGAESEQAFEKMRQLYKPFTLTGAPIIEMDPKSAEMTKYAANSMLATRISFMNEIANLCDTVGADVDKVRRGIGSDERIGMRFLFPGIGYGGSCFPKDVKALIRTGDEHKNEMSVLKTVEEVNQKQRVLFLNKIIKHYHNDLKGKTFAVWGLSFKPKTDDMREAPAIEIINSLLDQGAAVRATDPVAIDEAKKVFGTNIEYIENNYDCLIGCDAMILLTEWHEYREPDFNQIKKVLKEPLIFDGRNQYERSILEDLGYKYYCIGR